MHISDFAPLTSRDLGPVFWTPERLDRHSAWWGHVPFAFWLIANTEPRLLVELGTHSGVSYAAFCESVLRRRLATRCYAVDTWTGDPHAGAYEDNVYADLKEFHDKRYASFSQLVRMSFDDACANFADGTIDLLHIDGYHTYEAVRHDFDTWRPKLSDRALVLFHDTNERQGDFGVWRFIAELKQEVPVFEFLHAHGLGVAAVGAKAPEAANWLCGLTDNAKINAVRERFSLLGARWQAAREKSVLDAHAGSLQANGDRLQANADRLQAHADILQAHADTLEDALRQKEAQHTRTLAEARAELDAIVKTSEAEKQKLIAELKELNQAFEERRSDFERFDKFSRELAALRARPSKAYRDLFRFRLLTFLSHRAPLLSRRMAARFARSAQKRDPRRSLLETTGPTRAAQTLLPGGPVAPDAGAKSIVVLDKTKLTILVVSHDASRTGGPILALNLVQQFSLRYNVISLILGGGELIEHFRQASASLFVADRMRMGDEELDNAINDITSSYPLMFAIANTTESRRVLSGLKARGVPTVSLVHEFSANTRPRSAFPEVITLSTKTVFSTRLTLEDVVADFWLYPSTAIHIQSQGKCVVPQSAGSAIDASIEKIWLKTNLRPDRGSRKFLVIGVGSIDVRKGVDLFIDCATIIKNQPGGERFQFVWIGDDPYGDSVYSFFIEDQIKRAGLVSQMKILRSTGQIELAYQYADLLLITSRLDPLPNVAIDALMLGLPVLCFEKTTGIADFLNENGLAEQCVATYLDAHDLAWKVTALAASDDLRASVSERSRAAAKSAFDMDSYVSKIEAIAKEAVGAEALVEQEVDAILASGKFRSDFFMHAALEVLPEDKIVEDYVRRMASGLGIRKPMPGFQPTVYSWLQRRDGQTNADPFADFLRKGLPEGPWLQRVIQNADDARRAPNAGLRAALHLHAFYPDQLTGIVEPLNLNASTADLFISVVSEDAAKQARDALTGYRGRIVDMQVTPNRGRDIGPLLTQFGRALCASYDIIGHLHTKKSAHVADRPFAEAWSLFLLENMIGGKRGGAMFDTIASTMASDPTIGIVFPDDPHVISWTSNRKYADDLAARMKCGKLPEQFNFPVGSMFWMRAAVLEKFVELDLAWDDYAPEPLPIDGTSIHAIERLFGVVPATMDMKCVVTNVRGVTR